MKIKQKIFELKKNQLDNTRIEKKSIVENNRFCSNDVVSRLLCSRYLIDLISL